MPRRITRLGRWNQRISAINELIIKLADLVESLTLLTNKTSRLVAALAGLATTVTLVVSALR